CRETYLAESAEVARAEGALALQGFWHLVAGAPAAPRGVLRRSPQGADRTGLGRADLRRAGRDRRLPHRRPGAGGGPGEAPRVDRRGHAPARLQLRHAVARAGVSLAQAVRGGHDPPLALRVVPSPRGLRRPWGSCADSRPS